MRVIYFFILSTILIVLLIYSYKKTKDIFSPLCIFAVYEFFKYVPNILLKDYEHFTNLNEDNLYKLFLIELVVISMVCLGAAFASKCLLKTKQMYFIKTKKQGYVFKRSMIILVYLVGLYSRIRIIRESGGINRILEDMGSAYLDLSSGNGYFLVLANIMLIAMMMQLKRIKQLKDLKRQYRIDLCILFCMMVLYAGSFLIYSSRSPALEMIMILTLGYNYIWKKIKLKDIFKPQMIVGIIVLLAILIVMPLLRNSNINTAQTNKNLGNIMSSIFDEFSYVGRDCFVYDHFNYDNFWLGKSYLTLLTAPIPSSIYPNKPPIDDGLYLINQMNGYDIKPPDGRDELVIKYSIPFSTPGIMYANFGLVGIIISEFFLGILYMFAYKFLIDTQDSFAVILYQLIIYQLELGTLSIVQTLTPLLTVYFVYKLTTKFKIYRVRQDSNICGLLKKY